MKRKIQSTILKNVTKLDNGMIAIKPDSTLVNDLIRLFNYELSQVNSVVKPQIKKKKVTKECTHPNAKKIVKDNGTWEHCPTCDKWTRL